MSIIEFPRPPVTLDITMLGDYLLLGYRYCYRRHSTVDVIRTILAVCIRMLSDLRLERAPVFLEIEYSSHRLSVM